MMAPIYILETIPGELSFDAVRETQTESVMSLNRGGKAGSVGSTKWLEFAEQRTKRKHLHGEKVLQDCRRSPGGK